MIFNWYLIIGYKTVLILALVIQSVYVLPVQQPDRIYFENLALGKPTEQIGQNHSRPSSKAVDGNSNPALNKGSCSQAVPYKPIRQTWWKVDLEALFTIREVVITSTSDNSGTFRSCCQCIDYLNTSRRDMSTVLVYIRRY